MSRKKIDTELREILVSIPEDKKAIAGRLADELIFLQETMETLKQEIKERGAVEDFVNGSQRMRRTSPAMQTYTQSVKQYAAIYKQLCDLLPKAEPTPKGTQLYEFLKED